MEETPVDVDVERAKVAAAIIDSPDPGQTAYQTFYEAWLAWESSDQTRTMEA